MDIPTAGQWNLTALSPVASLSSILLTAQSYPKEKVILCFTFSKL
jgi:hypothetical protein